MSQKEKIETKLKTLLNDFGYKVEGNVIIQKGIRGFSSDRVWRNCRSIMDACEQLIPIVGQKEFSERYRKITAVPV